ncbi:ATP-dependent DNA helicase RecQ-like [Hydractinia symbiolongicarpus]|uniref:ATP-dependent DNA helicase RecQ-like n=1 Tax=Hydractinia symbiolongicarpus TaxID=13093 RepID=UPI0025518806|nr:ATP-dependent DNA helicase RecQ-like [Hydractinia symbiolongicarpus]
MALTYIDILKRISFALNNYIFQFCLKPKQAICLEALLKGNDVVAVLPTGFGKSIIFHLLADLFPVKNEKNIVLVISPLTSIINDQVKYLNGIGFSAAVLNLEQRKFEADESLFGSNDAVEDDHDGTNITIDCGIKNGDIKILFAHPESFLSDQGRSILKSKIYQQNVVACVADEAHCVEMWGAEFREDFGKLCTLKALFPSTPMIALTATAPPSKIKNLKEKLCFSPYCKVVVANPNRKNIFLKKLPRRGNNFGLRSYDDILVPIAKELNKLRDDYPMTIIYMKLKYCGYAYSLFQQTVTPNNIKLFCQFHAPQTSRMKKEILDEITKQDSSIRVVFATTALGMGVNAPKVTEVIHITPPANIESYMQEIGRAGRRGQNSTATLYYNNADIAVNKNNVDDSMKCFCKTDLCLRKFILNFFGFKKYEQDNCCSNCTKSNLLIKETTLPCRDLVSEDAFKCLQTELKEIIETWRLSLLTTLDQTYELPSINKNLVQTLLSKLPFIRSKNNLLFEYDVWDDQYATTIYDKINKYAPKHK